MKARLDIELAKRGLTQSRSQAENLIRLGQIEVDGRIASKPGQPVGPDSIIKLLASERYVSRAGLKLASVAANFKIDFTNKVVLDIGCFDETALGKRGTPHWLHGRILAKASSRLAP